MCPSLPLGALYYTGVPLFDLRLLGGVIFGGISLLGWVWGIHA